MKIRGAKERRKIIFPSVLEQNRDDVALREKSVALLEFLPDTMLLGSGATLTT